LQQYASVERSQLPGSIASLLLPAGTAVDNATLLRFSDASSRESFIKTITIQLMSTPEYQLC
jgi:hypothetical protein